MKRHALYGMTLLLLCAPAAALGAQTFAELQGQNAQRLSRADLEALLPGAKVKSVAGTGSQRYWTNGADGRFVASSDVAGAIGATSGSQGTGRWRVSEDGRFCVEIEWRSSTEKWCRALYKTAAGYFGVSSEKKPDARAYAFEFSR